MDYQVLWAMAISNHRKDVFNFNEKIKKLKKLIDQEKSEVDRLKTDKNSLLKKLSEVDQLNDQLKTDKNSLLKELRDKDLLLKDWVNIAMQQEGFYKMHLRNESFYAFTLAQIEAMFDVYKSAVEKNYFISNKEKKHIELTAYSHSIIAMSAVVDCFKEYDVKSLATDKSKQSLNIHAGWLYKNSGETIPDIIKNTLAVVNKLLINASLVNKLLTNNTSFNQVVSMKKMQSIRVNDYFHKNKLIESIVNRLPNEAMLIKMQVNFLKFFDSNSLTSIKGSNNLNAMIVPQFTKPVDSKETTNSEEADDNEEETDSEEATTKAKQRWWVVPFRR